MISLMLFKASMCFFFTNGPQGRRPSILVLNVFPRFSLQHTFPRHSLSTYISCFCTLKMGGRRPLLHPSVKLHFQCDHFHRSRRRGRRLLRQIQRLLRIRDIHLQFDHFWYGIDKVRRMWTACWRS